MITHNTIIEGTMGKCGYICAPYSFVVEEQNYIVIDKNNSDNYEGIFTSGVDTCIPIYFFYSAGGDEEITHIGMFHSPGSYGEDRLYRLIEKFGQLYSGVEITNDTIKIGIYINASKYPDLENRKELIKKFYENVEDTYGLNRRNIIICEDTEMGFAINFTGAYGEFQAPDFVPSNPFYTNEKLNSQFSSSTKKKKKSGRCIVS